MRLYFKAQAIAAHSYALYCRDHAAEPASGWLSVDPVRRQGYLTDAVLRSYWGTAYEENYARLSALVDSVLTDVLYYGSAPAGTSYFAISNGMTEASENVCSRWGASSSRRQSCPPAASCGPAHCRPDQRRQSSSLRWSPARPPSAARLR